MIPKRFALFGALLIAGIAIASGCSLSSNTPAEKDRGLAAAQAKYSAATSAPIPASDSLNNSSRLSIPSSKSNEIEFAYNGSFFLRAGETDMIVPSQFATGEPLLDHHVEFNLTLIEDPATPPDSSHALLATIVWPTNRIGSTVEQWLYRYTPESGFSLLWNLAKEQPVVTSRQLDGQALEISIPDYGRVQKFPLKDEDILRVKSNSSLTDPLNQPNLIQLGTPVAYSITAASSEPSRSWIVKRIVNLESSPFHAGHLYTRYRVQDHKVTAEDIFLSSSANSSEADILDLVLISQKSLPVEPAKLRSVLADATSKNADQMLITIQSLVDEGVLHESGGFYSM